MIHLYEMPRIGRSLETENRWVVSRSEVLRGVGEYLLIDVRFLLGVIKMS